MNLLLDTHIFLWYISGDARLPTLHRDSIRDPANAVFLSVASVWEVVNKHAVGKLPLPQPPAVYLPQQRLALIAQAKYYGFTLVTVDPIVKAYPVAVLPDS